MGPSGSGKTTLLNLAAGLDDPTAGQVTLLGNNLQTMTESSMAKLRRKSVGYLFQSLGLLEAATVVENIALALVLAGMAKEERLARIDELLTLGALTDKAHCLPSNLSGGQRQRTAALRALAHRPALLLLDEPTSCLDSHLAAELVEMVLSAGRLQQTAVLISTHDQRIVGHFDRRIYLEDGHVIAE